MNDFTNTEWHNARERLIPSKKLEPPIDEAISQIVGKKIYTLDPRVLKLIVKWKKASGKAIDSQQADNFLEDPRKREELKQVLSGNL